MTTLDWNTPAPIGRSYYGVLAPFSVACFVLTLLTDLAYWATDNVAWETFSVWLLTIGLIVAGVAVIAGLLDLVRSRSLRGLGQPPLRVLGHLVAALLALVNVFVHSRDGYTAVVPEGLILSGLTILVLIAAAFALGRRRTSYHERGLA